MDKREIIADANKLNRETNVRELEGLCEVLKLDMIKVSNYQWKVGDQITIFPTKKKYRVLKGKNAYGKYNSPLEALMMVREYKVKIDALIFYSSNMKELHRNRVADLSNDVRAEQASKDFAFKLVGLLIMIIVAITINIFIS